MLALCLQNTNQVRRSFHKLVFMNLKPVCNIFCSFSIQNPGSNKKLTYEMRSYFNCYITVL